MLILSCDTSTKFLNIVLSNKADVIASVREEAGFNQGQAIIPCIEKLLTDCDVKIKDIKGLAVGIGPGSFTGTRIGVATFKALAFALKIPITGIVSLDAIAYCAKDKGENICVMLDARRNNVYAALYESHKGEFLKKSRYFLGEPVKFLKVIKGRTVFLGDGLSFYRKMIIEAKKITPCFLSEEYWYLKNFALAELAANNFKKKKTINPFDIVPLYLYSKACTVEKR